MNDGNRGGLGAGMLLHVVCCGGIVILLPLLASGVLAGLGAWFLGGGWAWLAAAVVLFLAARHLLRRRTG